MRESRIASEASSRRRTILAAAYGKSTAMPFGFSSSWRPEEIVDAAQKITVRIDKYEHSQAGSADRQHPRPAPTESRQPTSFTEVCI
jgi:hypothetical protein